MQSNFRSSFFNLSPTALNSITALFATTYQRARHNYSSHVRSSLRNDDTSSRRFTFTFTSLDNRANNCKLARETRVQMLSRGRIGDNSRRNRGKTGWKRIVSIAPVGTASNEMAGRFDPSTAVPNDSDRKRFFVINRVNDRPKPVRVELKTKRGERSREWDPPTRLDSHNRPVVY